MKVFLLYYDLLGVLVNTHSYVSGIPDFDKIIEKEIRQMEMSQAHFTYVSATSMELQGNKVCYFNQSRLILPLAIEEHCSQIKEILEGE